MRHIHGFLIVNEFLNTNKFSEHSAWLLEAAKQNEIDLKLKTNAEILVNLGFQHNNEKHNIIDLFGELPDFVLFWDKDVRLARYLEELGLPVFNSSSAISNCDDKSMTHLLLARHEIPMPKTILAPMTFGNTGYNNFNFLEQVKNQLEYPMVIKECFGSFGAQVYLVNDSKELISTVEYVGSKPMLFQEFIASSKGKDIRLQVVGNKVITAMYRYSENDDFRANISNGGSMMRYEPNELEINLALRSCEILGLDFAGVDLLFGDHGNRLVCEVNSNAHFKNIFDCTGVNTAEAIIQYINSKVKA